MPIRLDEAIELGINSSKHVTLSDLQEMTTYKNQIDLRRALDTFHDYIIWDRGAIVGLNLNNLSERLGWKYAEFDADGYFVLDDPTWKKIPESIKFELKKSNFMDKVEIINVVFEKEKVSAVHKKFSNELDKLGFVTSNYLAHV